MFVSACELIDGLLYSTVVPTRAIGVSPSDMIVSDMAEIRFRAPFQGVTLTNYGTEKPTFYFDLTPNDKQEPILIHKIVVHGNVEDYSVGIKHTESQEQMIWDNFYKNLDTSQPLVFDPYKSFVDLAIRLESTTSGTGNFEGVMFEIIGCFGTGNFTFALKSHNNSV